MRIGVERKIIKERRRKLCQIGITNNMRLTITKEDMKNLNQDLGALSMDAANQIEFSLATRVFSADRVACQARITTSNEQIIPLFYAKSEQADIEKESFSVSAKIFSGVSGTLLSYNKDIIFDTDEIKNGKIYLRVGENVEIPVEVISQEAEVEPIVMGKEEPVFLQVTVSTAAFKKAARGSCFADDKSGQGFENTYVFLNMETGAMHLLSSDKYTVAKTGLKVALPESNEKTEDRIKEMDKALDNYCEAAKQTRQELLLLIPAKSFQKLQRVVDGTEKFIMASDSKHIFIAAGNKVYTLTKGAHQIDLKKVCDSLSEASYPVSFSVEYGDFLQAVSSLTKVISLKALGSIPIRVSAEQDKIEIAICGAENSGVISVQASTSGTGEIYLSAERMERVLVSLDGSKQVTVWFGSEKQAVRVAKEKTPDPLADDMVYIIPVKPPVKAVNEETQGVTTE